MHQAFLVYFHYLHQLYLRVFYVLKNEKKHQMIFQNENACSEKMLLKLSFFFINKVNTVRMIIMYFKNNILTTDLDLILSFFLILIFEEDFSFFFLFDYDFFWNLNNIIYKFSFFFKISKTKHNLVWQS